MTDKKLQPPSEDFERSFGGAGSLVISCEFCDRVHFATFNNAGDYDEGELKDLLRKAKAEPDKYIEQDYSSISWGYLAGHQYVHGCQCNKARAHEDFIWDHRDRIINYLEKRTKAESEEAQRNRDLVNRGKEALEAGS